MGHRHAYDADAPPVRRRAVSGQGAPNRVSAHSVIGDAVTVDAIDEAHGTVTVKAADASTETVKARNPQNLRRLKVGDELVISIYRAIAISLAKESGAGAS